MNKRSKRNRIVSFILIYLMAVSALLIIFSTTNEPASATWWNTSYLYSKTMNIANANNSYQMKVNVTYSSGGNVNCSSHCQADFDDIRFVDIDNSTSLDYWIQKKVNSNYCVFWVETPADIKTDNRILMYYGNNAVTTTSNFNATFIFGELWNTTNLITSRWDSVDGTPTYTIDTTNHYINVTDMATTMWVDKGFHHAGNLTLGSSWQMTDAYTDTGVAFRVENPAAAGTREQNFIIFNHESTVGSGNSCFDAGVVDAWNSRSAFIRQVTWNNAASYWQGPVLGKYDFTTWRWSYLKVAYTGGRFLLYNNSILVVNETITVGTPNYILLQFGRYTTDVFSSAQIGSFKIHKFAYTEPSWSSFGSELSLYSPTTLSSQSPANTATGVSLTTSQVSLSVTQTYGQSFNVKIRTVPPSGAGATAYNNYTAVTNNTFTCPINYYKSSNGKNFLKPSSVYTWYVNSSCGTAWTNATYTFTTREYNGTVISGEAPTNGSTNVSISIGRYYATINDECGFDFNWTISLINSSTILHQQTTEGLLYYTPSRKNGTKTLYFTYYNATCDFNSDGFLNNLDTDDIISHYGGTGAPGWIPEDLYEDGTIDIMDVSVLFGVMSTYHNILSNSNFTVWINTSGVLGWHNESFWFTTGNYSTTTYTNNVPANHTTGVSRSLSDVHITIQTFSGTNFDWYIETSRGDSNFSINATNGTMYCPLGSLPMGYDENVTWWVNSTDDYIHWNNVSYWFVTEHNDPPAFTNELPANTTINVSRTTTFLTVDISDAEGHTFNWTIESSRGDSSSNVWDVNGTAACIVGSLPMPYDLNVTWWVNCSDQYGATTNATYWFTTPHNYLPVITLTDPNNITGVGRGYLLGNYTVIDQNGHTMNITITSTTGFYWSFDFGNATGSIVLNSGATKLPPNTNYTIWINVTDGVGWTNRTYWFVTEANVPPLLWGEDPVNSSSVNPVTTVGVSININDSVDSQDIWVNTSLGDSTFSHRVAGVHFAQCLFAIPLAYSQNISWTVTAYDGYDWSNATYWFTTLPDIFPPTSSVNTITPYSIRGATKKINATATDGILGSGVKNVSLYYRYSADNITFPLYYNLTHLATKKDGAGDTWGIWSNGTYVYAACGADGLRAYSFNGTNFTLIDTETHGGDDAYDVWSDGTYIYVASGNDGLEVYSFNGVALTFKDDDAGSGGLAYSVHGDGTYIYVAEMAQGLDAFSFNGVTITFKDNIGGGGDVEDVYCDGTYIYTADGLNGTVAYSFDGANFHLLDTLKSNAMYAALSITGNGTMIECAYYKYIYFYTFNGTDFTQLYYLNFQNTSHIFADKDLLFVSSSYGTSKGLFIWRIDTVAPYYHLVAYNYGTDQSRSFVYDGSYVYGAFFTVGVKAYSLTNSSYSLFGTDIAFPWSWSFNAFSSPGYYQFVSIATDNSNNTEAFPISADAYVYWYPGNSPIVSNPIPANHAVDVLPIITYWNCTITDVEGDPFNFTIQFFNATMVLLKSYSENSSSNGTKSINISGLLNTSRIYYIKVNCTDIDGSPQYLFDFTTIDYYIYYLFTYSTSMDGRRFVFTSHVYTNVNIDFVNWRFGDGGTSQIFNPVHYYGASGNFNCIGTVENVSRGISATYTALFTFQPVVVPSVLNNPLLNLDWTFFYYMVVILIILVLVIIVVTLAKRSGGRR